jgi:hypothetical protein
MASRLFFSDSRAAQAALSACFSIVFRAILRCGPDSPRWNRDLTTPPAPTSGRVRVDTDLGAGVAKVLTGMGFGVFQPEPRVGKAELFCFHSTTGPGAGVAKLGQTPLTMPRPCVSRWGLSLDH